jgi:hypothetical protein
MKTKLAGHFPLQDALRHTIQEAKLKIAASEKGEEKSEKDEKKAPPFGKKDEKKESKKEEAKEKESSAVVDHQDPDEVEKLAASLDYVAEKLADYTTIGGESHQGGEVLPVQSPAKGKQVMPTSKGGKSPAPAVKATKDNPGPANAMVTDDERAPGGNGAKYPEHGVLKTAETESTRERARRWGRNGAIVGGGLNLAVNAARGHFSPVATGIDAGLGYGIGRLSHRIAHGESSEHKKVKKSSVEALKGVVAAEVEKLAGPVGDSKTVEELADAAKHRGVGQKAYDVARAGHGKVQQLGTAVGRTLRMNGPGTAGRAAGLGYGTLAAGTLAAGAIGKKLFGSKEKEKSSEAVDYILNKISTVYNGGESPQGGEQLSNTLSPTMQPGRSLIQNKDAIKNVTKPEAKAFRKKELAEVLSEPASHRGVAPNISGNLRSAASGGVKTAAKRALLSKIAAEGCKCTENTQCRHCHLKEATASIQASAQ